MRKLIFLCFCVSLTLMLQAQDCSPGWTYYRTVTVDNTGGENLADYQVSFTLNTAALAAAGKLQADGADLRVFANDCTPLPFWGDSLGTSTETRIFVKVPTLATGASLDLQVYYGNAMAEAATNGDDTFIFFDDFAGEEVDASKWEAVGEFATFEVRNGLLRYASTSMNPGPRFKFARTKTTFAEKVIFDFVIARSNANGFGFSSTDVDLDRFLIRDSGFGFDTLNQIAVIMDTLDNGSAAQNTYPLLRFERNVFNTVSITPHINDQNEFAISRFANEGLGDENITDFVVERLNMSGFHFIVSSFAAPFTIETDNIRVRQHTDNPPATSVGAELNANPSSIQQLIDPRLVQVYPNPSAEHVTVRVEWEAAVQVEVRDAHGRLIPNIGVILPNGSPQILSVSELPAGSYYLQLRRATDGLLLHTRQLSVVR